MLRKVVVVPPDPLRGMGVQRNSAVTQQSGHAPRSEPEIKNVSFVVWEDVGEPAEIDCWH